MPTEKRDPMGASLGKKEDYKFEKERIKDRKMVKGMFKFDEIPGATLEFVFRAYKGDPIEKYSLRDGEICTIPLGVAKHLNKNGWYPEHEHLKDEKGNVSVRVGKKVRRFSFQSLDFIDTEELLDEKSPIITIEKA